MIKPTYLQETLKVPFLNLDALVFKKGSKLIQPLFYKECFILFILASDSEDIH